MHVRFFGALERVKKRYRSHARAKRLRNKRKRMQIIGTPIHLLINCCLFQSRLANSKAYFVLRTLIGLRSKRCCAGWPTSRWLVKLSLSRDMLFQIYFFIFLYHKYSSCFFFYARSGRSFMYRPSLIFSDVLIQSYFTKHKSARGV